MKRRKIAVPITLAAAGVMGLMGCIPLPATQQFMTNGNLKPYWKVGKSPGKPIRLGHTTIKDAIHFLDDHLSGPTDQIVLGPRYAPTPEDIRKRWLKIDARTWAVPFEVRDAILIWPLCGIITSTSHSGFLVLKTDEADCIIDYETLSRETYDERYEHRAKPLYPELQNEVRSPAIVPATTETR